MCLLLIIQLLFLWFEILHISYLTLITFNIFSKCSIVRVLVAAHYHDTIPVSRFPISILQQPVCRVFIDLPIRFLFVPAYLQIRVDSYYTSTGRNSMSKVAPCSCRSCQTSLKSLTSSAVNLSLSTTTDFTNGRLDRESSL